jgi:hypothetical protein
VKSVAKKGTQISLILEIFIIYWFVGSFFNHIGT